MAATAGTMLAAAPVGGYSQGIEHTIIANASAATQAGDLMVQAAGELTPDNAASPAPSDVVGMALHDAAEDEDVLVALALPTSRFEAHLINNVTDITPSDLSNMFVQYNVIESLTFLSIDTNNTTVPIAMPLRFAARQVGGQGITLGTTKNPRVEFVFVSTCFFPRS